jgi:ribosome recycling factor
VDIETSEATAKMAPEAMTDDKNARRSMTILPAIFIGYYGAKSQISPVRRA